jgi:hypothetical protein
LTYFVETRLQSVTSGTQPIAVAAFAVRTLSLHELPRDVVIFRERFAVSSPSTKSVDALFDGISRERPTDDSISVEVIAFVGVSHHAELVLVLSVLPNREFGSRVESA